MWKHGGFIHPKLRNDEKRWDRWLLATVLLAILAAVVATVLYTTTTKPDAEPRPIEQTTLIA